MVQRNVLSVADAVEIVEVASDVQQDIEPELGQSREISQKSINALQAISASLKTDMAPTK